MLLVVILLVVVIIVGIGNMLNVFYVVLKIVMFFIMVGIMILE